VSLRRNQLIPVNKAVNEKEQLEKGLEEEEKKILSVPKPFVIKVKVNLMLLLLLLSSQFQMQIEYFCRFKRVTMTKIILKG
jgi:hypothetical protein